MAKHMPGPWKVGYRALDVMAPSERGGDAKVCDIRGWGYLTGKGAGALGLSDEQAVAIQEANARLIAAAPAMLNALKAAHAVVLCADDEKIPKLAERIKLVEAAIAAAEGHA